MKSKDGYPPGAHVDQVMADLAFEEKLKRSEAAKRAHLADRHKQWHWGSQSVRAKGDLNGQPPVQ